jgi:predicted secreted protein with PEFG-CTERM motif
MMNTHLSVFALSAIIIASIAMAPAFGQVGDSITVTTDKTSYLEGETIKVTGKVREFFTGVPVSLTLTAPNGNVVTIEQPEVSSDKTFSSELIAGGPLMKSGGTYTIEVLYGTQSRISKATFTFGGSTATVPNKEGTTVKVVDTDFMINYKITGGKITSITPDVKSHSLIIAMTASQDGSLTITLPRALIDSKEKDTDVDAPYFVLVDDEEVDFKETATTTTDRTLEIQFPAGTEQIEIIGTKVVPEFGTIAVMILAVAIISIIAISARSRLSVMPRY